jgi:hypothetical protein
MSYVYPAGWQVVEALKFLDESVEQAFVRALRYDLEFDLIHTAHPVPGKPRAHFKASGS